MVVGFGSEPNDDNEVVAELVLDNGGVGVTSEEVASVVTDAMVVSVGATSEEVPPVVTDVVVSVAEITLGVVCGFGCAIQVVVGPGTRPPVSGGTAYGGSNSPNAPHALHGEAQDLTGSGATRIGSHRPSGAAVAITEAASVWGQLVPRSLRVSCRVADSLGTMVDTWSKSRANTTLVPEGPARPAVL